MATLEHDVGQDQAGALHLKDLFQKLGYTFNRTVLLEEALQHASYVNETDNPSLRNNERLEFLGDAVLGLAISDILMKLFEDANEGDLSKCRASVVNEKGLWEVAKALELGSYIRLGKGEEGTGGREKPSILANSLEALLGALFLDAGFSTTLSVIRSLFMPFLSRIDLREGLEDYKSLLQEYTQERFKTRPQYLLADESGPAHRKRFRVSLHLNGEPVSVGEGTSKKEAEQRAARKTYLCLTEEPRKS